MSEYLIFLNWYVVILRKSVWPQNGEWKKELKQNKIWDWIKLKQQFMNRLSMTKVLLEKGQVYGPN